MTERFLVAPKLLGLWRAFVPGRLLTREIAIAKPAPRRIATAVATTFAVASVLAVSLHGMIDARPEIEWTVRLEKGTAARYDSPVERFRRGTMTARELAGVIERNIIPELRFASARLTALEGVPREQQPGNTGVLRTADEIETTSLELFQSLELTATVRQ